MKLFKRFARAKLPAPAPEQELFPAADMQETAEADAELIAAFDALYLSSLARRRKAVIDAFTEAANYSPLPGPARDSLAASFKHAVDDLSSGPQLFSEGFRTTGEISTFGSDVTEKLRAVAQNSRIPALRQQALAGIVATAVLSPVRVTHNIAFLIDFAMRDADPAMRGEALRSLAAIATNKDVQQYPRGGLEGWPVHADVRSYDNFARYEQSTYVTREEYLMGVAAYILKADPEASVRQAAAQAIRDIASANPPKYQFLAASHASEAQACQTDARVRDVIQGIFADSRVVNFKHYQRVPGLTA